MLHMRRIKLGRWWAPVPEFLYRRTVRRLAHRFERELRHMPLQRRRVRACAVRHLMATGRPVTRAELARQLELPLEEISHEVAALVAQKTYLVEHSGQIHWAFPVTVTPTPHRITLATGEPLYGA